MITAIWLIRGSVALIMLLYGINQLMNPAAWFHYIPESLHKASPVSPETQMRLHALGNIVIGLFLIAGTFHPLIAAWIALIWWISILPFAFRAKWDIGMRDLTIIASIGALIALLH